MELYFQTNDEDLKAKFQLIFSNNNFSEYVNEFVELIYNEEFTKENISLILANYQISNIENIKEEVLDLLLQFINLVLNDNVITATELKNLKILKKVFKIVENDFYELRNDEIKYIYKRQFDRIYSDNFVNENEALQKVDLQELFDLSYDQFWNLRTLKMNLL